MLWNAPPHCQCPNSNLVPMPREQTGHHPRHGRPSQLAGLRDVTAETVFGQSVFGHPYLTIFGQSIFALFIFWPFHFWPIKFWPIHGQCIVGSGVCHGGGGGPNPEKVRPRRVGRPKFRALFPSPFHRFRSLCLSHGVSSRGFLVVFEAAGVSHNSPRAQTCTFGGSRVCHENHHNSTRRHPERETKRAKMGAGEGEKKKRNVGRSRGGRSRRGGSGGRTAHNTQHTTHNKHTTHTQHTHNTTHTHTHTTQHTQHTHNPTHTTHTPHTQHTHTTHTTHVGTKRIGQKRIGQKRTGQSRS